MSSATWGCSGRLLLLVLYGGWVLCLLHQQLKSKQPLSPAHRAAGGREGGVLLAGHSPPEAARAAELCCLVCPSMDILTFSMLLGLCVVAGVSR